MPSSLGPLSLPWQAPYDFFPRGLNWLVVSKPFLLCEPVCGSYYYSPFIHERSSSSVSRTSPSLCTLVFPWRHAYTQQTCWGYVRMVWLMCQQQCVVTYHWLGPLSQSHRAALFQKVGMIMNVKKLIIIICAQAGPGKRG